MNYITNVELKQYYDARRLLQLISDTGVAGTTDADLTASTALTTAIRSASSRLDSALQSGRRYERSQIEDIVTAANAGGASDAEKSRAEPIKTLVADLAFGHLMARRGYKADTMREMAPRYDEAEEKLNQLCSGERILDLDSAKAAGVPTPARIGSNRLTLPQYSPLFGIFPNSPAGFLYPYRG